MLDAFGFPDSSSNRQDEQGSHWARRQLSRKNQLTGACLHSNNNYLISMLLVVGTRVHGRVVGKRLVDFSRFRFMTSACYHERGYQIILVLCVFEPYEPDGYLET